MQQLAIVVPLRKGADKRAAELLAAGAPFDPGEAGFERHAVYLTGSEAVFVFEGPEVEWRLDDLVYVASHPLLRDSLNEWAKLVDGQPRRARRVYSWSRDEAAAGGTGSDSH